MIERLKKRFPLMRRMFCRHPNLQDYRRAFLPERKPWEYTVARYCPDCDAIVWQKEIIK